MPGLVGVGGSGGGAEQGSAGLNTLRANWGRRGVLNLQCSVSVNDQGDAGPFGTTRRPAVSRSSTRSIASSRLGMAGPGAIVPCITLVASSTPSIGRPQKQRGAMEKSTSFGSKLEEQATGKASRLRHALPSIAGSMLPPSVLLLLPPPPPPPEARPCHGLLPQNVRSSPICSTRSQAELSYSYWAAKAAAGAPPPEPKASGRSLWVHVPALV